MVAVVVVEDAKAADSHANNSQKETRLLKRRRTKGNLGQALANRNAIIVERKDIIRIIVRSLRKNKINCSVLIVTRMVTTMVLVRNYIRIKPQ